VRVCAEAHAQSTSISCRAGFIPRGTEVPGSGLWGRRFACGGLSARQLARRPERPPQAGGLPHGLRSGTEVPRGLKSAPHCPAGYGGSFCLTPPAPWLTRLEVQSASDDTRRPGWPLLILETVDLLLYLLFTFHQSWIPSHDSLRCAQSDQGDTGGKQSFAVLRRGVPCGLALAGILEYGVFSGQAIFATRRTSRFSARRI